MSDQAQGRIHDIRCGTVIFFQYDFFRVRIIFVKMQHDLRSRPAETIDRLIVIPDHKEIVFGKRKHFHDVKLKLVDVLEFIDQNITVLFLPGRKDVLAL